MARSSRIVLSCVATIAVAAAQERRSTLPQKFFDWTTTRFAAAEYRARCAAMIAAMKALGVDVFLAPSSEGASDGFTFRQLDDFWYFTGLELPRSVLAIDARTEQVTVFAPATDRRFENPARRNDFPGRRLAGDPELARRSGADAVVSFGEFDGVVAAWVEARAVLALHRATEHHEPTLWRDWTEVDSLRAEIARRHPDATVRDARAAVAALRTVKSAAELRLMRAACEITARGIADAAKAIRSGVDERTLEGVLEASFKARGAQRLAFASIIKSGPNSLWPWRILAAHYDRRNRAMHDGDLVIFDVGCELDQYSSDVGRTFPVSGEFTPRQRELVELVTAVSDAVIAAVKPGTTLRELQRIAAAEIPARERRYMQTGLFFGHHIGLAVGDPSRPGTRLKPGMVFTVEPWYYNHDEDLAVFIEDVVAVTADGAENLTAMLPRTAAQLEAMVGGR